MLQDWQVIDETFAQCARCTHVFLRTELNSGVCQKCLDSHESERQKILSKAEDKVMAKGTKAAARLMADLEKQGKKGSMMPLVMDRFYQDIGGPEAFGGILHEEFQKLRGADLTPEEAAEFNHSPKMIMQFIEILLRYTGKTDEGKQLDVSSLEQADLEALLVDLALAQLQQDKALRRSILYAAIKEDKEFRKLAFEESITEEPELIDHLLRLNGIETVDGVAEKSKNIEAPIIDREESYKPEDDEYTES